MEVIEPSVEILTPINGLEVLKMIELAGRTCYKSEDNITDDSCMRFVKMLIDRNHTAMLEHYNITFKIITNRGVTHELVRHRIASYAQESTRYVNYNKKGIQFIKPCFVDDNDPYSYTLWYSAMTRADEAYQKLIKAGWKPEQAREVLPNSLKTEIVVTMNLRELRHMLTLRTSKFAHPEIRKVMTMLLEQLKTKVPVVFDDIVEEK